MRRLTLYALTGFALTVLAAPARAELTPVTSLQPLLITAIREGYAEGTFDTPESRAFFQREFATSAPLEYRVKRIEAIADQPGCARLAVHATQRGVIDRNATQQVAAPQTLAVAWEVAYCEAGHYAGDVQ